VRDLNISMILMFESNCRLDLSHLLQHRGMIKQCFLCSQAVIINGPSSVSFFFESGLAWNGNKRMILLLIASAHLGIIE
jgi:hypothetical protein